MDNKKNAKNNTIWNYGFVPSILIILSPPKMRAGIELEFAESNV